MPQSSVNQGGTSGGPQPGRESESSSNGGSAQIAVTWRRIEKPRQTHLDCFHSISLCSCHHQNECEVVLQKHRLVADVVPQKSLNALTEFPKHEEQCLLELLTLPNFLMYFLIETFHENAQRSSQNTQFCMNLPDLLFEELNLELRHGQAVFW